MKVDLSTASVIVTFGSLTKGETFLFADRHFIKGDERSSGGDFWATALRTGNMHSFSHDAKVERIALKVVLDN